MPLGEGAMNGWDRRFLLTAGVPLAHIVRGPSPMTVLVQEASHIKAASGNGLSAVPAARETFWEIGGTIRGTDCQTKNQEIAGAFREVENEEVIRWPHESWYFPRF